MSATIDPLANAMKDVALAFFGEPNKSLSTPTEWRWGNRGSLSIDIEKGVWIEHGHNPGGGVLDLIKVKKGLEKPEAILWMETEGFLPKTNGAGSIRPKIVATYDYVDDAGTRLFQVCRLDPKSFRQRRSDGNGGWTWKLGDVRRTIYRLPQVIAAVEARQTIYIAEGEKAVHAIEGLGLIGTCCPGGAMKWRKEFSATLAGASVVILPDFDQPGQDHAADVARSLQGTASSVRVLMLPNLPVKGDCATGWPPGHP